MTGNELYAGEQEEGRMKRVTTILLTMILLGLTAVAIALVLGNGRRKMITVKGKGDVIPATPEEREYWRNHPDYRPPWEEGKSGIGKAEVTMLVLVGLISFVACALYALRIRGAPVRTRHEHSVKKHGEAEVATIQNHLECNGPDIEMESRSWRRPNDRAWLCEVGDDQWGIMIVRKLKDGRWMELTTFMLGSAARMKEYVTAKFVQVAVFVGFLVGIGTFAVTRKREES